MKIKTNDEDWVSQNWLLLYRLGHFGYTPEEAVEIGHKITSGEIKMEDVPRKVPESADGNQKQGGSK